MKTYSQAHQDHLFALADLAGIEWNAGTDTAPALYRKLRRIEALANRAATAQCNGEAYQGQPFRPDWHADGSEGTEENPTQWEVFSDSIRAKVAKVFGGKLPAGFRFNQDPRGYALKLDNEKVKLPQGMYTDWGGYGILAPDFN
jgi:hypothetical protein